MTEFIRSTAKVDQAVIDATSGPNADYERMRAAMRTALQAEGIIVRNRENELGVQLMPGQQQPAAVPAPPPPTPKDLAGNELLSRVVTVGGQSHLLTAYSVSGLDVLERGWRQSHGGTTN